MKVLAMYGLSGTASSFSSAGLFYHVPAHVQSCASRPAVRFPSQLGGYWGAGVCVRKRRKNGGAFRNCGLHVTYAAHQPYPFSEDDYYRATLQIAQIPSGMFGRPEGNLVFIRAGESSYDEDRRALVLSVGGDTLQGIVSHIDGTDKKEDQRPFALDLLWKILNRGQEIRKRDWKLVRVAIVELRKNVYYGRLFFGDTDTGNIVWDCDCRPSDACWLSLKENCPVYIHKEVWDKYSVLFRDLLADPESAPVTVGGSGGERDEEQQLAGTNALTTIRSSDPDPIKRLKREMAVALREEDYAMAARIRDHPFMIMHQQIITLRSQGKMQEAQELQVELLQKIKASESSLG